MPVLPGAEPYRHEGGEVGVLLCHGFTGSPQALRPWAEYLAGRGLTVALPLLPGHGTRWEELRVTGWQDWYAEVDRELRALCERCAHVFVAGLSMGGALALRLAAKHGGAVGGVVLVNPSNKVHGLAAHALPLLRHLVPTTRGITGDIAKEGVEELGYDRVPLHAAHSLRTFLRLVDGELPQVTQPLLLLRSPGDHVVPPADSERVLGRVSSTDVTEILLEQSHHVATLDHDADRIFEETHTFVTRLVRESGAGSVRQSDRGSEERSGAGAGSDERSGAGSDEESGAGSDERSGSVSGEQSGAGSVRQREGTATGG
ncbi:alpha/beta fold hydrolase [Streptomyces capitiformicae]|uniref:Esterase n=1 Tax=Streptomyces capitiformicae TaxID=2014920 RepID=A0A919GIW4_9ACTN|nr:alpha/beta fold hydrolase [Streptomyces capitiformicae]GHH84929.1 esterase [Streptomyces capitiformicae]